MFLLPEFVCKQSLITLKNSLSSAKAEKTTSFFSFRKVSSYKYVPSLELFFRINSLREAKKWFEPNLER
jgi:hypothetical protein